MSARASVGQEYEGLLILTLTRTLISEIPYA